MLHVKIVSVCAEGVWFELLLYNNNNNKMLHKQYAELTV